MRLYYADVIHLATLQTLRHTQRRKKNISHQQKQWRSATAKKFCFLLIKSAQFHEFSRKERSCSKFILVIYSSCQSCENYKFPQLLFRNRTPLPEKFTNHFIEWAKFLFGSFLEQLMFLSSHKIDLTAPAQSISVVLVINSCCPIVMGKLPRQKGIICHPRSVLRN